MRIFKEKMAKVWLIVTAVVVALLLVVNILASTVFYNVISIVLGTERRVGDVSKVYVSDYADKQDALVKSGALTKEIVSEGITLLKNDNALPIAAGSKVSVFGKNSVNLVYGGSGSGAGNNASAKTIFDSLDAAGLSYNTVLRDFYMNNSLSGEGRATNPEDLDNGEDAILYTGETPQSAYTEAVKNSYSAYADVALIVISRIGGEGFDLPRTMQGAQGAREQDDHFLQLDANERDLVKAVCAGGFDHVIVVINSANPMELGFLDDPAHYAYSDRIDGCLWMAGPGNEGVMALGEILTGKKSDGTAISPSGHLVDTYARDFKSSPTWNNFGTNLEANGDRYFVGNSRKPYYFVSYEEGIYVGYRYYETRYVTEGENGDQWYKDNVVFPFGFGLSYTKFDWQLQNKSALAAQTISKDDKITFDVMVVNSGNYSGKDVVQLYVETPYTEGEIEKSAVELVGFDKTRLLASGENDVLTLEVDPYELASYDYDDANGNEFRGYELEAGDYVFSLRTDAHTIVDTVTLSVAEDIRYETDPVTDTKVENLYDDADDQLSTVLSRADWEGTWPTRPTAEDRTVDDAFIAKLADKTTNNPNVYTQMPVQSDGSSDLKLADLAGADYYDERWEELLNIVSVDEMLNMFENGAFTSAQITSIGKPRTIEADGPVGFCNFMDSPLIYETNVYCSQIVLAATWNTDLAYAMGESVGNEGILGDIKGDKTPYSGWYAPGLNIHRSPFGGRNFEYMSEDGFLSGEMASSEVLGCKSKGVYTYVKHFALNEQETHRSSNGVCTWVTEQAMREIYLSPFEKVVKEGKTTAIMSSFNRIGTVWAGGDYRLLTTILRDEWGFKGTVVSDFNTNDYMNCRQMIYAGGDLNLSTMNYWEDFNASSAADVSVLRNSAKNICYTVVNSNAVNVAGSSYIMPLWQMIMFIADGVIAAAPIVWGAVIFVKIRKKAAINEDKA